PGLSALGALGFDDFFTWLRDGILLIVAAVAMCVAAALVYAFVATPRYTVYTDIVVDPSNLNVVSDDVFTTNPQRDAQLLEVESKLRVLTSRNVLARVIETLRLTEDPEFVKPDPLAFVKALFGRAESDGDNRIAAMRALSERVEARREERSFVVVLKVWSEEPAKAVTISDAIVEAFEQELFHAAAESAGRVADNLKERLDELRENVTEAERRVEEFRRANGLQSSNGELVSNQLSTELNTQVLEAQQRLIQAQSRFTQMSTAIERGQAASASVFDSETMTSLREQSNTLQQQIGSIERTYGPRHPRMVSALSERATLEGAMGREARRILELARADLAREQAAFDALRGKADEERANVFSDNAAQVQLRDLEREARTRATIYETYLARTQQIAERQQIDATNVRVISRPVPPQARSWPPRTLLLLAAGVFAGLFLGMAAALGLGLWRYIRTPQRQPDGQPRPLAA
ncbi:MAG: GumC family protein, partial [Aquamicrobium sp.]|nr:GumC family protein [Aquamicrobium sp.]